MPRLNPITRSTVVAWRKKEGDKIKQGDIVAEMNRYTDRKILIGVFEGNSRVNNYFDGPFDQLPDNFIKGEELRNAILAAAPELAGKIDRFGIYPGGAERYLIGPYRHYRTEEDLLVFDQCATDKHIPAARYYECFVFEGEDDSDASAAAPRAKKKMRARAIAKHR